MKLLFFLLGLSIGVLSQFSPQSFTQDCNDCQFGSESAIISQENGNFLMVTLAKNTPGLSLVQISGKSGTISPIDNMKLDGVYYDQEIFGKYEVSMNKPDEKVLYEFRAVGWISDKIFVVTVTGVVNVLHGWLFLFAVDVDKVLLRNIVEMKFDNGGTPTECGTHLAINSQGLIVSCPAYSVPLHHFVIDGDSLGTRKELEFSAISNTIGHKIALSEKNFMSLEPNENGYRLRRYDLSTLQIMTKDPIGLFLQASNVAVRIVHDSISNAETFIIMSSNDSFTETFLYSEEGVLIDSIRFAQGVLDMDADEHTLTFVMSSGELYLFRPNGQGTYTFDESFNVPNASSVSTIKSHSSVITTLPIAVGAPSRNTLYVLWSVEMITEIPSTPSPLPTTSVPMADTTITPATTSPPFFFPDINEPDLTITCSRKSIDCTLSQLLKAFPAVSAAADREFLRRAREYLKNELLQFVEMSRFSFDSQMDFVSLFGFKRNTKFGGVTTFKDPSHLSSKPTSRLNSIRFTIRAQDAYWVRFPDKGIERFRLDLEGE